MSKSHHQVAERTTSWTCFEASLITSWHCFAEATSFHGLKYIATERKIYQKVVWLICILVSFTCVSVLSYYLYFHYMAAPTKTIVKSQHYPSAVIPFPAITVCPPNKISIRKVKAFLRPLLKHYRLAINTSTDEDRILRAISQISDPTEYNLVSDSDMKELDKILKFGRVDVSDLVAQMSIDCNEWFTNCIWSHEEVPCKTILQNIITSEGLCCSFNYKRIRETEYSPLYTSGYDLHSGLSLVLAPDVEALPSTKHNIRFLIHDPFTFPENIKTDFLIQAGKETAISMRIVFSQAESLLRKLSVSNRGCVFRDEYQLEYFQAYTFENCITECQLRRYYERCRCIPHYFGTKNEKLCEATDMSCIIQHSTQVLMQERGSDVSVCVCPNECDMFLIKTSLAEWTFHPMNDSRVRFYAFFAVSPQNYEDLLIIHFASNVIRSLNRFVDSYSTGLTENSTIIHTYFGQSYNHWYNKVLAIRELNFTSSIGGIVLLFMGSSLISILELIYYFTWRLYKTYRRIRIDTRVLFKTKSYLEFNKMNKL